MNEISAVDGLLAQMRAMRSVATAGLRETAGVGQQSAVSQSGKVDFTNVLKSSLDSVARAQETSESMQKAFVMGDDKVSLSDTMIAMQKAGINFQATVQVRNKFVQAYNDIMNMQV
ncbi:MAG: flagellar hook-basal body complex protein FliE [Gallionella sp.]|nr:flagellar hook-basal body complex protein FliE [Gallionella sp.]MDD4945708.1 flagellar hook-basal body complex protein FliE [Gallionella sp.]